MKRTSEALFGVYDFHQHPSASEGVKRPTMMQDLGSIPLYERTDLFPANAEALNKALDYNLVYKTQENEEILKLDEATIRYQIASGAYQGARIIRELDLPHFKMRHTKVNTIHRIPEEHYLNMNAEPARGLHTLNPMVKSTFNQQKVTTTGSSNAVRSKGFERDDNPKIYPRLPTGLSFRTESQRPTSDAYRLNGTLVDPIATFPKLGF